MNQNQIKNLQKKLWSRKWRINSGKLYKIKDKNASIIPFKPNRHQQKLHKEQHNRNIILKARQLGFSTDIEIQALDYALFNANVNVGIIAHNLEMAKAIFKNKIRLAWDHLPKAVQNMYEIDTDRANELQFTIKDTKKTSRIKVSTSFRSDTINFLHISEFGKICAKKPDKAEEIVTGAIEAVPESGFIFVESTAEGQSGQFYEMTHKARKKKEMWVELSPLDYKFHFFPWWKQDEYRIEDDNISIDPEYRNYFNDLSENYNINLDDAQKKWYINKADQLKEKIYREYPSYWQEAFKAAIEWAYYEKELSKARKQGRICNLNYKEKHPIYVAWDIGGAGWWDDSALWFFQKIGKEYRFIDYWAGNGYSMEDICMEILDEKTYNIHKIFLPHDARQTEQTIGKTRADFIRKLWYKVRTLDKGKLSDQINLVRENFEDCYFDEDKCEEGLEALWAYRRKYDEKNDVFRKKPIHNWASHWADSFRYAIRAIKVLEAIDSSNNKNNVIEPSYDDYLY